MEASAELAHHGHAQLALAIQHFTDPACGAQNRHEISARKAMLIHQVLQQVRHARRTTRPSHTLVGFDQPGLRCHARTVSRITRPHQLFDQRLGFDMLCIAPSAGGARVHTLVLTPSSLRRIYQNAPEERHHIPPFRRSHSTSALLYNAAAKVYCCSVQGSHRWKCLRMALPGRSSRE